MALSGAERSKRYWDANKDKRNAIRRQFYAVEADDRRRFFGPGRVAGEAEINRLLIRWRR